MIITISGQYGSGGNEVGIQLAERLNYRILDNQLVTRAREIYKETSGSDEKPKWWPSRYNAPFHEEDDIPDPTTAYEHAEFKLQTDLISSDAAFENLGEEADAVRKAMLAAQSKAIWEYTEDGNCIVLGKCANFVLRGRPDVINVFSLADMDMRVERIMNLYNLTMDKMRGSKWTPPAYVLRVAGTFLNMSPPAATSLIKQTDKRRAACYEFLTGEKWGDKSQFDLILHGDRWSLEEQTQQVLDLVRAREAAKENT